MSIQGYVESHLGAHISGWAWDSERPELRVALEIYRDNTLLCRLTAENFRQDLKDAGIGDGGHGFSYNDPALVGADREQISVIAADVDITLNWGDLASIDFSSLLEFDPYRTETLFDIVKRTGAFKPAPYLWIYEHLLEPVRFAQLTLLELGVRDGGSLQAWAAYLPYARIAGLDLSLPALPPNDRIHMFCGEQADTSLLARAAAETAPDGFDIVIDDCSHIGALAKASFWYLFENHLKPGGYYIIEDWGTGYMSGWPDGRGIIVEPDTRERMPSHDAGMVGFIKQLVDEVHAGPAKFASMTVHPGVCVIRKAASGSRIN